MEFSNVSARHAARAQGDRSVLVIAFMMALVFIPVLATHITVLICGQDDSVSAWREGIAQVGRLLGRAFS